MTIAQYNTQADYDKRVDQVTDLLERAINGHYLSQATLKEAISTSDLPLIFADITNYQLQAAYKDTRANYQGLWQKVARRLTVPNFLPQTFYEYGVDTLYGGEGAGNILAANGGRATPYGALPNVPEGTEYPTGAFKLFTSQQQLSIRKNGARVPFTFEAMINDQWDLVRKLPQFLLSTALDSEDIEVTSLLTDGDGPNDAQFNSGNGTLLKYGTNTDGTAALTRETLKTALYQAQHFYIGNPGQEKLFPVTFDKFAVVIPPALKFLADDILNSPTTFIVQDGAYSYTDTFSFGNQFEFVIDPWLHVMDKTHGDTAWYVVPFNGDGVRTGLGLGFLLGNETPELRIHNDQGLYLGGGAVPQSAGSFRNDTWEFRIRHIYGGAALNGGIGTVASTGAAAPTTA